ncbi:MAG TPA: O-antigen ligase family protein [Candidatus Sulfotelmatobacter sp.]|nr:O-antigen ligase family protein [Candidatus Sulfotelmatobacter sp.]
MSRWRGLGIEHLFGGAAIAAAPVSVYAPAGMTVVASLAGVGAILALWRGGRLADLWRNPFAPLFALLMVWGTVSFKWALHPEDTLSLARSLILLFIVILALVAAARGLDEAARRRLGILVTAAVALGVLLLAIEEASGVWLSRMLHEWQHGNMVVSGGVLDRGLTVTVLLGFVAAIGLARRGWLLPGFAAMFPALLVSFFANSHSARIAAAVGIGIFILVWFAGPWLVRGLGILAGVFVLIMPMLPFGPLSPMLLKPLLTGVKYSALHRLYIWEFTAHRIADHPLAGWGLNSARTIPGGDQVAPGGGELLALHPHNGALQVWLELGLPGAILFAALLWLIFAAIARLEDRFARAAAAGLAVAALGIACLSFGIWQNWWVSSLGFAAALAAGVSGPAKIPPGPYAGDRLAL